MHANWDSRQLARLGSNILLVAAAAGCRDAGDTVAPAATMSVHSADLAGDWAQAVNVDPAGLNNLNTAALEGCPAEATDARTLFFASNRDGQIDIWMAQRQNRQATWGSPTKVPAPVSVDGANDFCPTPLPGGGLLFVSTRAGGCGLGSADIYESHVHPGGGWSEPENLGCEVNSGGNEFSPSYVGAGGGLLFFSSDREGGPGQDRIYMSLREPGGDWSAPVEVPELNAAGYSTARPNVSQDGRTIVFDSNRPGGMSGAPDVWVATRASINDPWSEPAVLGSNVNSASGETRAWLSTDGRRLYFGSNREGNFNIYVASR